MNGPCPLRVLRIAPKLDDSLVAAHYRGNCARENNSNNKHAMSHLKVIRGNFARQFFTSAKNGRKPKGSRIISRHILSRSLATKTSPNVDNKYLTSPYGEIVIGKETLTEFVFEDVESWADKPSVVSTNIHFKNHIHIYLLNCKINCFFF